MAHARETIRNAITGAVTGLKTTGASVFTGHVYPFEDGTLPNLSIYYLHEPEITQEENEMGDYELRLMPFQIAGRVRATTEMENTLDDICEEVETAIHASATVANYVKEIRLVGTEMELDGESEQPVGVVKMDWLVLYRVDRTEPTAPVQ